MEPFLHSISHLLMQEEGTEEDAPTFNMQQVQGDDSYQTILRSFYDIIGELPPPPKSYNGLNIFSHQLPLNSAGASDQVPYWEKDKALSSFTSCSGPPGSNAPFRLPSPYKEFSLSLAVDELSFEGLKLHDHYASLYVGTPGINPTGPPNDGERGKALAITDKRGKSGKRRTALDARVKCADLRDSILMCAQSVAMGDTKVANEVLQQLKQAHGASAFGNATQRIAHYFSEALVARMRGSGGHHFRTMLQIRPSAVTLLKLYRLSFEMTPLRKTAHYFANQNILKAAERASRLHIVDFGLVNGVQWAFLINALAEQKGDPPFLVITGIGFPQPGNNPAAILEESGWRLAAHARTYNVPFQFHAIASSKWEDLHSSSFHLHEDEVLVVNCIMSLRNLVDVDGAGLDSPRQKFLACIHSLKPHLLITADVDAASNSSFVSRFRAALYYYSNMFDMFESVWGDRPGRVLTEMVLYREILNIVACEGVERVEKAETYKQWQVRIERAGFKQLLIPQGVLSRARWHVKQHYHKEFFILEDGNKWMLLGWRGRTILAISAWKMA